MNPRPGRETTGQGESSCTPGVTHIFTREDDMLAGCLELLPARPSPTVIPILIKWEMPLWGIRLQKSQPFGTSSSLVPSD